MYLFRRFIEYCIQINVLILNSNSSSSALNNLKKILLFFVLSLETRLTFFKKGKKILVVFHEFKELEF